MMDEFASYGIPHESPSIDSIEPTLRITVSDYSSVSCDENQERRRSSGIIYCKEAKHSARTLKTSKGFENNSIKATKKRQSSGFDKSMYAIFFRQQQPIIKSFHPTASFGEISRLIAIAWERIGEEQKKEYKAATMEAKKNEMHRRIAMRTLQLCGGNIPTTIDRSNNEE